MGEKKKPAATAPAKIGRPSKFDDQLAARIYELAKQGKTDEEIGRDIGVSVVTLRNWKGTHPDFLSALNEAKSVADELVKASLFRRACGYSHPSAKFFMAKNKDKDGNVTEKVIVQPYIEHYPPDPTSCIFWLKNRDKANWRDRHEVTGEDGAPIPVRVIVEEFKG